MEYEEGLGGGSHVAPKSKHNEVVRFFPVSVDNFFDNPDRIVRYAKSLPKEPDPIGKWPGKRTEALWKIDKELNQAIVLKILSCYYDLTYQDVSWGESKLYFQEIPAFSKNKNDIKNKGWIHFDSKNDFAENDVEVAGLIYLTPDIDPDSGTSLFAFPKQKGNENKYQLYQKHFTRHLMYKEEETVDEDFYAKKVKDQEGMFNETVRFSNIYNRMIMYDAKEFHRANNFYNEEGKDVRLTLPFFLGGLDAGRYPLERVREINCEEFIEYRTNVKQ